MRRTAFIFCLNLSCFLFILKNPLRFYWGENVRFITCIFLLNSMYQVLKDFSVENLKTTLSTFLSKLSTKTYLSRIINYWVAFSHWVDFYHLF